MIKIPELIKSTEAYCQDNGLRLTPPRKFSLSILSQSKTPMGAYDVLDKLGEYINPPKPPTAYHALDFWRKHGFVHKIESLNAYMACCEDHTYSDTHFLVCDDCSSVTELHHYSHKDEALPQGFVAKRTFTETHGTCGACVS
jgi:Fur family zinc uptake transcriptional regulator